MQKPYLIQRGKIKEDLNETQKLSEAINFDYMGSAEFEFGAIPRAFRFLKKNSSNLRRLKTNINGKNLCVIHIFTSEDDLKTYLEYIHQLSLASKDIRLKERPQFSCHFEKMENEKDRDPIRVRIAKSKNERLKQNQKNTTFLWDIENGVIWFFDNNLASLIVDILSNSFKAVKD